MHVCACREEIKATWEEESVSAADSWRSTLVRALSDFQLIGKYFLKYCRKVQENHCEGKTIKLVCRSNPFAPYLLEDVMVVQVRDVETVKLIWCAEFH